MIKFNISNAHRAVTPSIHEHLNPSDKSTHYNSNYGNRSSTLIRIATARKYHTICGFLSCAHPLYDYTWCTPIHMPPCSARFDL